MIETTRIGHMIGPPLRKLSMKKFPLAAVPSVGRVSAGGAAVAAGCSRRGEATAGAAGEAPIAGAMSVAAGEVAVSVVVAGAVASPGAELSGAAVVAGAALRSAATVSAGEAAGSWAKVVSARLKEHRLTISVFFI